MKYIIETSTRTKILIDQEDFEKFKQASVTGSFMKLKQGIVNPSFVVSIIPVSDTPEREVDGYVDEKTGRFVLTRDEISVKPLTDVFSVVKQLQ